MLTKYKHATIATAICLTALITACSDKKQPVETEKFAVNDSLINRLLKDTVQQANRKTDLVFSAKITANEERKAELFPMVSGTVNTVAVRLGDKVSAGQTLATVISTEMAGFDKEVVTADAELKNAKRALQQAEQLFESGLSSARELEEAKNEYNIKTAELKRASAVLKLNGGGKSGLYTIKSPISGFVIDKNVTNNMQLRSDFNNALFTVADLTNVWAMVNIYESDIAKIKVGDEVNLSALSYPDQIFKGKIDKIYNLIDPESKVMNARVTIENPSFLLKPGMLGTVKVSGTANTDLPLVSSRAIIFDDNNNYVLVLNSDKKIRVQKVELGSKTADKVFIKSGLNAGDVVISSKQVFLFESLKSQ
ncbi:MAG: efflux RND transporter periplasmic adaptor subunit [Flavobacterium sp.]|nr:MAG: efflux RND transporter periplasmic adaptor subunit [Flavobacterium sp.]